MTTVRFDVSENGADSFIDLVAPAVHEATLNGGSLDPAEVFADSRIALRGLLEGRNILRAVAECAYTNTGEGLHRFVDPVDDQATSTPSSRCRTPAGCSRASSSRT
ncbi:hypothetical protein STENM327S_06721 [Streptomyces tendae]